MGEQCIPLIYLVDTTRIDIPVRDYCSSCQRGATIRPWLTICGEPISKLVIASRLSGTPPDKSALTAVICSALLLTEERPYGGAPGQIWTAHCKEDVAEHIKCLARELDITLRFFPFDQSCSKEWPERFFLKLDQELWSTLIGSPGFEGEPQHEETELTLGEVRSIFDAFIDRYHHQVDGASGQTPLEYWNDHCFPEAVDPRLLKVSLLRRVSKRGISFEGRSYSHAALAALVGKEVVIRVDPIGSMPESIEVFDQEQWVCTAGRKR